MHHVGWHEYYILCMDTVNLSQIINNDHPPKAHRWVCIVVAKNVVENENENEHGEW